MLNLYPTNNVFLGTLSGLATLCKTLLTAATFLCLGGGGLTLLLRRARSPAQESPP
jgi:hypothetical protein